MTHEYEKLKRNLEYVEDLLNLMEWRFTGIDRFGMIPVFEALWDWRDHLREDLSMFDAALESAAEDGAKENV